MKNLGDKIAQKRKDTGMTQSEFAEKLSVTRQTVSRWESGAIMPDIDKLSTIADRRPPAQSIVSLPGPGGAW